MRHPCKVDIHPLRMEIEARMRENVFASVLEGWISEQTPDKPVSRHILSRHRRDHVGLKSYTDLRQEAKEQAAAVPVPAGPKPSEALGRPVNDDDIEQKLKARFYDSIDLIPADKVAELMIEREKAKGRVAAKPAGGKSAPTDEDVPTEIADLRAAANAALGPKRTRTSARTA